MRTAALPEPPGVAQHVTHSFILVLEAGFPQHGTIAEHPKNCSGRGLGITRCGLGLGV